MMYTAVHDEFLARAAGGLVAGVVDQHIDAAVSGDDRGQWSCGSGAISMPGMKRAVSPRKDC